MKIRKAKVGDVDGMHWLISYYAERRRMLFRTYEELYERIREFYVCVDNTDKVIGCCGLCIFWKDLAEIRSLAVHPDYVGRGIGRKLVEKVLSEAKELGIEKVFALTVEPEFFEKIGFKRIDKKLLPYKVWKDCLRCPIQDECNEIPVIYYF